MAGQLMIRTPHGGGRYGGSLPHGPRPFTCIWTRYAIGLLASSLTPDQRMRSCWLGIKVLGPAHRPTHNIVILETLPIDFLPFRSMQLCRMDLILCAGLAILETLLSNKFRISEPHQDKLYQTTLALFLVQYLLLKYYRVFLYHKYFSPLRNVPGPTVSKQTQLIASPGAI